MKKDFYISMILKFASIFLIFHTYALWALPFESQNLSITGPSPYLKETAQSIYKQGGNVVDVAVASAITLAVVTPFYVSLGCGGFALVDMGKGLVEALDFREKAPQIMDKDYYKDKSSVEGGSAVGVPGFVAGMRSLHKKYGQLPWKKLFSHAIQLAENGYVVGTEWVRLTSDIKQLSYGMDSFVRKENPYKAGDLFKQKSLASALKKVQLQKMKGFYRGPVAQDVVQTVNKYGGAMTLEDLKNYQVRWLKPVQKTFKGYQVYSMPPPSSGGLVLEAALDLIEKQNVSDTKLLSVNEAHMLTEVMSRAFRARSLIGDPDFYNIPYERIIGDDYLNEMASSISKSTVQNLNPVKETTHLSVMDKEGRSVTMTLTLNLSYGAKVVTSQYGIVLNNQLDDFTTRPNQPNSFGLIQGKGNLVQGGKRPLSSMSPTLIRKDGKTVMALGGSGGPRIISGVLQVLYRSLVNGLDIDQAVQFPRVHHQFLPRTTFVEKNRWSPDVLDMLSKRGHKIKEAQSVGKIYGIQRTEDNILQSAFDHRGDGIAWGM